MKKEASLSIVEDTTNKRFLMIRHHRGINNGCINFPGGKKEEGETMLDCVIRETFEETGLTIKNPIQVGYVEFPSMNFYVHIFKSTEFSGSLKDKEDEVETFWQDITAIPYDEMREADRDFIPDILAGKYVKRRYNYDKDFHLISIENL
ncbi:MAG: 8-oxo-dGTP diphosphatase [Alphaproteobacteria bacterium]|nr:8-oxo-dGTP diphosphatase [Alphaproteobacteria bacterium]